jgi:hypothetical protein
MTERRITGKLTEDAETLRIGFDRDRLRRNIWEEAYGDT